MNFVDDFSIPNEEYLYRALHPSHIKPQNKVSSATFKSRTNPHVSVDRSSLTSPEETLSRNNKCKNVFQIKTEFVRGLQLKVVPNPIGLNNAHALIIQELNTQITDSIARKLARASEIIL